MNNLGKKEMLVKHPSEIRIVKLLGNPVIQFMGRIDNKSGQKYEGDEDFYQKFFKHKKLLCINGTHYAKECVKKRSKLFLNRKSASLAHLS